MEIVRTVLNKYDLQGFIKAGIDLDYAREVNMLTDFINNNKEIINVILLADKIQFAFIRYFYICHDMNVCIDMAEEILNNLE